MQTGVNVVSNLTLVKFPGMNLVASEEISLDRTVPDVRMEECQFWNYPSNLPKVSSGDFFKLERFINVSYFKTLQTCPNLLNALELIF